MRTTIVAKLCLLSAVSALTFVAAGERDAQACGGCFGPPPPPTESPTVVTDHRMILTVSKEQSTLYDQIRYQGSPQSFAWVLPISGTVDVGISADVVFSAADQMTTTTIQAPPLNCPPQPSGCANGRGGRASASDSAGAAPNEPGVNVLKKEVVGPYETVQLEATDPQALHLWLAKNGFVVPDDVKPVIDTYVGEKFNFLALKLVPGKDVKEMRPVRVTTQGANVVLPLRMVAAGTGPVVGITLWVIGEGRYEPQNFKSFYIKTDELVWDWTAQKSNYVDLRAQRTKEADGKIWELENSPQFSRQSFEAFVRQTSFGGGRPGGAPLPQTEEEASPYLAVKDEQGNVLKTAVQAREDDLKVLFAGINANSTRVTRMRADLNHDALKSDLVINASQDQAPLPTFRQITRELNQPQCPVWNGCSQSGTAPRDQAFADSSDGGCRVSTSSPQTWGLALLGIASVTVLDALRRRRKENQRRF
jgi:hypothetical protein